MELTAVVDPAGQLRGFSERETEAEKSTRDSVTIRAKSGPHALHKGGMATSTDGILAWRGQLHGKDELGERSKRPTDTGDLLLHLFETEGLSILKRLPGRFLVVYYDCRASRLIFARDKLGWTPVTFYRDENLFFVSTHLEVLRKHLSVSECPNRHRLGTYLMQVPVAGREDFVSPYERLLPSEAVVVSRSGGESFHKYYSRVDAAEIDWKGFQTESQNLRRRLEEMAVRYNNSSVVYEMSGGMDSTALVGIHVDLARNRKISERRPKTGSLVAPTAAFSDEGDLIEAMRAHFPVESIDYDLSGGVELFNADMIAQSGAYGPQWHPGARHSIEFRKSMVKAFGRRAIVAGQGGDHLFRGSSERVLEELLTSGRWWEALGVLRRKRGFTGGVRWGMRRIATQLLPGRLKQALRNWVTSKKPWLKRRLWVIPQFSSVNEVHLRDPAGRGVLHEWTWRWESFVRELVRKNRFAGVRYIFPYFEPHFVEIYSQLPARFRYRNSTDKALLRNACRDILPSKVLNAPKRLWLGHVYEAAAYRSRKQIQGLFEDSRLAALGLIDVGAFLRILRKFMEIYQVSSSELGFLPVWRTISAEVWLKEFFP